MNTVASRRQRGRARRQPAHVSRAQNPRTQNSGSPGAGLFFSRVSSKLASFDSWSPTPSIDTPPLQKQDRQMATHYETLDIDTDASPEEIRRAYKKAVLRLHPDRRRNQKSHAPPNALDLDDPQLLLQASLHGTASVMKYTSPPPEPVDPALEKALLARFHRIQAAYDVLSVPEKRRAYDKEMLADEEMSLFGERKAQREARNEARRGAHRPARNLPPPIPENPIGIKPPFVWDVDRKQPLFWDPNPEPNHALPSGEAGMQLIRKEDAAASSKYIITREAAVKRLMEINDENYGEFKFIKGVSLGAVELQAKDLVPVRRPVRRRHDSADTLVAPEPAPTLPPMVAMEIPEQPPKKTDIRRTSQIVRLAHAMTTADLYQARLKLEKEQALLTRIESVKAQEEAHRLRVEKERQRVQFELQKRMAILEKERERIRAEEEFENLRVEQDKLAAATAQLSSQMQAWPQQAPQFPSLMQAWPPQAAQFPSQMQVWPPQAPQFPSQMQAWPQQVKVARKPQRPRVNSEVGGQKENTWPKQEGANEWSGWDAGGGWGNVEPTGADAGWGTTWDRNWENPNYHKPLQQKQENRKSRSKDINGTNAWVDGWSVQPPENDMTDTGRRTRSRSRSFSVGQAETKQRARSRERADYWEQTKPAPEEKPQPRKLTKQVKVRFDMVDVPEQFRPYEPPDETKGTLSGFKRLFGRA